MSDDEQERPSGLRAEIARDEIHRIAVSLIDNVERLLLISHEYREVDATTFRHLNLRWYAATQRRLEGMGFKLLTDVEDAALKQGLTDPRTFLRLLVRQGGEVMAACYHPKPRWLLRLLAFVTRVRLRKVVELETEFDDGVFICTTDSSLADEFELPAEIDLEMMPGSPTLEALLARHDERVETYLAQGRGSALKVRSFFDALQAQNRQNALRFKHREEVGLVTLGEITRFLKGNEPKARLVKAEVERILEERQHRG